MSQENGIAGNKPSSVSEKYKQIETGLLNDFDLALFIFIAKRSIPLILFYFIVAGASVFFYLRYTPPLFESFSVIQIRNNNAASNIINVTNMYQDDISADIELLRSREFLQKTLSDLPLEVSYYTEGQVLSTEVYLSCPYNVTPVLKDSGLIGTPIYIEFASQENAEVSYSYDGKEYKVKGNLSDYILTPHVAIKVSVISYNQILSEQNKLKKNTYFFIINDKKALIDRYHTNLNVALINAGAKTVKISLRDYNAAKAADIVSSIASGFITYDVERRSEGSKQVIDFIDSQINAVYTKLRSSETSLQEFQKETRVSDKDDFTGIYIERLTQMENEIVNIELEEKILIEIEKKINSKDKKPDIYSIIPLLSGTNFENNITEQISTFHQMLLKREQMMYEVTPTSEVIKSMDFQINIQKTLLVESIKSLREKVSSKRENIAQKLAEYEKEFFNIPEKEIEYARLKRIFTVNEKFYSLLVEKRTEFSIAKAGFVPEHIVLDKAKASNSPVSPQKGVVLAGFIIAAIILSVLSVSIRYLLHNTITSLNDIVKLARNNVNTLGIIPKFKENIPVSQLIVDKRPKSIMAESFRTLRTNMQFINNKEGSKTVAITSTVSGEGKTFVAINLGGIIALTGKKVLIVDLDMRKPKIHIGFNSDNTNGMSTLLIGKDNIENCIKQSEQANLDYITAGPIPPNPSELIINGMLDKVLDELKLKYDYVIMDTPPVDWLLMEYIVLQEQIILYIFSGLNFQKRILYIM
jgi:tyrosine-protein kinase Etk/Wzc